MRLRACQKSNQDRTHQSISARFPGCELKSSLTLLPALTRIIPSSDFIFKLTSNSNGNNKYQSSCSIRARKPGYTPESGPENHDSKAHPHLANSTGALPFPPPALGGFLKASLQTTHPLRKIPRNQQFPLFFPSKALPQGSSWRIHANPALAALSSSLQGQILGAWANPASWWRVRCMSVFFIRKCLLTGTPLSWAFLFFLLQIYWSELRMATQLFFHHQRPKSKGKIQRTRKKTGAGGARFALRMWGKVGSASVFRKLHVKTSKNTLKWILMDA